MFSLHFCSFAFSFCFILLHPPFPFFFFFNDTATTEIYTLSLHDALPILSVALAVGQKRSPQFGNPLGRRRRILDLSVSRSEEHTSELQSHLNLVCRLLLEKKKTKKTQRKAARSANQLQLRTTTSADRRSL